MPKYKRLADRDYLADAIIDKTLRDIASEIGCSQSGVLCALKKFNISVPKRIKHKQNPHKAENIKLALKRKYPNGRYEALASNWRGGKRILNGYYTIYIKNHPRSKNRNHVFEHIIVAEKALGRYLATDEIVHHINGNKLDNHPNNLKVMKRSEHVGYHFSSGKNIQELVTEIKRLQSILKENKITY